MEDEIFYHVFQRSFYDSNGDGHGDLVGLTEKLDYIQSLGATAILLLPLYESVYYHNYFATDFEAIDPRYGTKNDFLQLVRAIHSKGMKIYLDMEVQYVAEDHHWFRDSYENPDSPHSEHIIFNGPGNTDPESIIFDLKKVESYDGTVRKVACLNIFNPSTQAKILDLFLMWLDPHQDGSLEDSVDGFRLDHMMDDLDGKGKLTSVYGRFWRPIIDQVREVNPRIKFMGEQADWESQGSKGFHVADVDYMFAFPLKFAISELSKDGITYHQQRGMEETPAGKSQIILLENHDTARFASVVDSHPAQLRVGAALNLLLKGTPMIYYGQELGMRGTGGFSKYGISDGNDIPRREAMPWYSEVQGRGMALWYKDSGPWWDDTELKDHDGISVEEQEENAESLLTFYRKLIKLRKRSSAIKYGSLSFIDVENPYVLVFERTTTDEKLLFIISLSSDPQYIQLDEDTMGTNVLSYPQPLDLKNGVFPYNIHVYNFKN